MPRRRKDNQAQSQPARQGHEIIQRPMDEVMHLSMLPYAEHVILERALPRVEDGLKPVQRRILFTMNELGITPDKPHKKCARIVGDCLGKYHPHGDSSVYDALVRLAQPYSMRGVLVDGHGNFGSIDGDSAAAMRYTEARMAPLALEMLRDIDKDTVPFSFNFDDTLKEPDLLPARFPNLLVNGTSGIAVGLATNIPPHNLKEAINAAVLVMENPDVSLDEIMKTMPGPDFPTGGCLLNNDEIRSAYETGKGKLTLRARVHTEDGTAGRKLLVITEVPYQVPKAQMLEKILKLTEEKKNLFSGIYDIRDESDRTGLRAVIELRKDADPDRVLSALYKYSDLQITFGVNMVAIADGRPAQMGIKAMLSYYIAHQKTVITKRTRFDLDQAKAREHILAGLIVAVDHLDEVIAIIRKSKNPKEAKEQLENSFGLTDIQAQAILDMRLQRLTNLEVESLRQEYRDILATIDRLQKILSDEKKMIAVIRKEMLEIRDRFGDERRTMLVRDDSEDLPVIKEAKASEETVVLLMLDGQLKRVSAKLAAKTLQQENAPGDIAIQVRTYTDRSICAFTNLGACWVLDVQKIPEVSRLKERGMLLSGMVHGIDEKERAIGLFDLSGETGTKNLLFTTKNGQVKRSAAEEYVIRRSHFTAITLKDNDEVIDIIPVEPDDQGDLLLVSGHGHAIRFAIKEITCTGRVTAGVRGILLNAGDYVSWAFIPTVDGMLAMITERGYGKRLLMSEVERQPRARSGQRIMPMPKSGLTGSEISGCLQLEKGSVKLSVQQKHGTITVLSPEEIPVERRSGSGVLLVSVLMDDIVTGLFCGERRED